MTALSSPADTRSALIQNVQTQEGGVREQLRSLIIYMDGLQIFGGFKNFEIFEIFKYYFGVIFL